MKDLMENSLVRFKNIEKNKHGIFVNFKVKGERGGAVFSASISVDINSADLSSVDSLETIIDICAKIGVEEFKKCNFHFEGIASL
ncbi:MAG: hypothetical protein RSB82_00635 [Victivallaceae bacterium]